MKQITKNTFIGAAASIALASGSIALAPVAQAATSTWYSGNACHNVWRAETGSSTSLARKGQEVGGNQIGSYTLQYGNLESFTPSASYASITTRDKRLTTWTGRYKVEISGGATGECSGNSNWARAWGIPTGGMRSQESSSPTTLSATETDSADTVSLTQKSVESERGSVEVARADLDNGQTIFTVEAGNAIVTTRQSTDVVNTEGHEIHIKDADLSKRVVIGEAGEITVEG